jgi:predicted aldo/keto reductase-like oxidoreductase
MERGRCSQEKTLLVHLPMSPAQALVYVDMILLSHLHSDHFDRSAQEMLIKDIDFCCQPQDEARLKTFGFSKVHPVEE